MKVVLTSRARPVGSGRGELRADVASDDDALQAAAEAARADFVSLRAIPRQWGYPSAGFSRRPGGADGAAHGTVGGFSGQSARARKSSLTPSGRLRGVKGDSKHLVTCLALS